MSIMTMDNYRYIQMAVANNPITQGGSGSYDAVYVATLAKTMGNTVVNIVTKTSTYTSNAGLANTFNYKIARCMNTYANIFKPEYIFVSDTSDTINTGDNTITNQITNITQSNISHAISVNEGKLEVISSFTLKNENSTSIDIVRLGLAKNVLYIPNIETSAAGSEPITQLVLVAAGFLDEPITIPANTTFTLNVKWVIGELTT